MQWRLNRFLHDFIYSSNMLTLSGTQVNTALNNYLQEWSKDKKKDTIFKATAEFYMNE